MFLFIFDTILIFLLVISLRKILNLQNECLNIQKKILEIENTIGSDLHYLRQKFTRNLIFQRNVSNETIPIVTFQKLKKTASVLLPSDTVYTLAEDQGFGLSGTCEGNGDCGLCAMSVSSGNENLSPIKELEKEILEKLGYPIGTRLSCQARINGDTTVNFLNPENQT